MGGRGANSGYLSNVGSSANGKRPVIYLPTDGITIYDKDGKGDQRATVETWEENNRTSLVERSLVVDQDGNVLSHIEGNNQSVKIEVPASYNAKPVDPAKVIAAHIHPDRTDGNTGGTFSDRDVLQMLQKNIGELRARATDYVYSMRATTSADRVGFAKRIVNSMNNELLDRYRIKIGNRALTISDKEAMRLTMETYHEWYEDVAKQYGYEYSRKRR